MTTVLVISQEMVPIFPTHAGAAITPDLVAAVPVGTDLASIADNTFTVPPTIDDAPAVWVRDLPGGTYKVVCKMDTQPDTQAPVWELDGTIVVQTRA